MRYVSYIVAIATLAGAVAGCADPYYPRSGYSQTYSPSGYSYPATYSYPVSYSLQASVSEDSAAQRSPPGGSPVISWTLSTTTEADPKQFCCSIAKDSRFVLRFLPSRLLVPHP